MDTERIVYDSFAYLYDRAPRREDGQKTVSLAELLRRTEELKEEDVRQVLDSWVNARFLTREGDRLALTADGKVFFKSKYRV